MVIVISHGKWAVDVVSCRDHREVRQGVCEGIEGGYWALTIKPIGYGFSREGQRRHLHDEPTTPLDRLLAAGVLSPAQQSELLTYRDSLNPAAIARQIGDL